MSKSMQARLAGMIVLFLFAAACAPAQTSAPKAASESPAKEAPKAEAPKTTAAQPTAAPAAKEAAKAPAAEVAKPKAGAQIKIPVMLGNTGPAAAWTAPPRNSVLLAEDEINKSGGFNGANVSIELQDPGMEPAQAANLARSVGDWALVILGPGLTLTAQGAVPVANQLGIPIIHISSVPDLVTKNRPNAFGLLSPPKDLTVNGIKGWVGKEPGIKKLGLVKDSRDPAAGIQADGVVDAAKAANLELLEAVTYSTGDTDLSAQVTKLKGQAPDGIAIAGLPTETGALLREIRRQEIKAPIFVTQSGWTPDTAKIAGPAMDGAFTMVDWTASDPGSQNLVKAYNERFKEPINLSAALFYDAIYIVRDVFQKEKLTGDAANVKAERDRMREGLAKVKDWKGIAAVWTWPESGLPVRDGVLLKWQNGEEAAVR